MLFDDLYTELGIDYSLEEQDQFFDELVFAVENASTHLGSGKRKPYKVRESLMNEIHSIRQELKACTTEFSPVLEVYPLSKETFNSQGYEVPLDFVHELKQYQYALVNIPITLVPIKGWGFTALDCIVAFNPDRPLEQRPVAHQLFPSEEWEEKISFSQRLSVGVDEHFNFQAVGVVPTVADAKTAAKIQGGFRLVLGPYNYHVCLPKVTARGSGNVKVRWRLEGEENIQQHDLKLGVVLKVPREVKKVELVGVMTIHRKYHALNADIRYLVEYLQSRGEKFFKQGTPPVLPPGVWDITDQLKGG